MTITALSVVLVVLLLSLLAGLYRVLRGPEPAERMLAAQLLGTTAVALLVVLSQAMAEPALLDVALVFAVLAAVTIVCFVVIAGRGVR
jgi:multicomponent Na+:H+ antiporter subunit F